VNCRSVDNERDSAERDGEPASHWRSPDLPKGGRPSELRGSVLKRRWGARTVIGDGTTRTVEYMNQRDLAVHGAVFMVATATRGAARPGVRAAIVALKRRNGRGAKGRRKVDA